MSADEISWRVVLSVRPHQLESFKLLTEEMVEASRKEEGVLSYGRFITDDGSLIHVYERYQSSTAAIQHLVEFKRRFGARFSTMVDRNQFFVYGTPTEQLKDLLNDYQPIYLKPFGSLDYWL